MAFIGLIMWIAIYVYGIANFKDYVDDAFSFELQSNHLYYALYCCSFPAK
jgi:hypothetical protein